jgi:hypothetical protein
MCIRAGIGLTLQYCGDDANPQTGIPELRFSGMQFTATPPENEQIAVERIVLQRLLRQKRKAPKAFGNLV